MSLSEAYSNTRPFDVNHVCANVGFVFTKPALNQLSQAAAGLIADALSADWGFRIGTARAPKGAAGAGSTSVMLVIAKDDKALVAEITFYPSHVTVKSLDARFDIEEKRLRYVVGGNQPVEFANETLELKEVAFTTSKDAGRDIAPVAPYCSPVIHATGEIREIKARINIKYPNILAVQDCPFKVRAVPSNNPGVYVVERDPSASSSNIEKVQILELPIPIQPEAILLYHMPNLPLPWMKEFLYCLFELKGRKYFSSGRPIKADLSEEEVESLARKLMPFPYSVRGEIGEVIRLLEFPRDRRGYKRDAVLSGPAPAELLNLVVDKLTELYTAMVTEVKKQTGKDISFSDVWEFESSLPSVKAIRDNFHTQNTMDIALAAWCLEHKTHT